MSVFLVRKLLFTWHYQSKRYCPVLVVQHGGGRCISPLGGAFRRDQNRTIPFGLLKPVRECFFRRLSRVNIRFNWFLVPFVVYISSVLLYPHNFLDRFPLSFYLLSPIRYCFRSDFALTSFRKPSFLWCGRFFVWPVLSPYLFAFKSFRFLSGGLTFEETVFVLANRISLWAVLVSQSVAVMSVVAKPAIALCFTSHPKSNILKRR